MRLTVYGGMGTIANLLATGLFALALWPWPHAVMVVLAVGLALQVAVTFYESWSSAVQECDSVTRILASGAERSREPASGAPVASDDESGSRSK